MYLEYVRSWTRPRKPDRTSAKVRIPIPDAYVYGLTGDVDDDDDERDSDAERVVIMTPIVTRITDMIWVRVYLENDIQLRNGDTTTKCACGDNSQTFYLTPTIQ